MRPGGTRDDESVRDCRAPTRRVTLRALLLILPVLAFSGAVPATATVLGWRSRGTRPPTKAERKALKDATYSSGCCDKAIIFVRVSVADSRYAIVGWTGPDDPRGWVTIVIFGRSHGRWQILYDVSGRSPAGRRVQADGACAVAPAAMVRDLYHFRCSFSWRELHGRPATASEAGSLQMALNRYFAGSVDLHPRVRRACVSRVTPRWTASDTSQGGFSVGFVWFEKKQNGWRVEHIEGDPTPRPPHAIVLSLGSCVGYFPSDYY